ncbi:hypothetical protein D3C74_260780 [compost metagenome]
MVINEKFEHLHRIAAVDVKGTVKEFNDLRAMLDQIKNVRLHPFNIVIPHPHLDAREAKLATERAAAACLEVDDPFAKVRDILGEPMRRRQRVQIGLGPAWIQNDLFPFAVGCAKNEVELSFSGQLLQQMVERLLAIPHHDKVDLRGAFHPIFRVIADLGSAQYDLHFRQHFFE